MEDCEREQNLNVISNIIECVVIKLISNSVEH